jgi:hypothetical protein
VAALTWEEFREIERIKELKARYFRLLDTHQWPELANVFTSDVQFDIDSNQHMEFTGRDPFIANVSSVLAGVKHVHHGHMPEIALTGTHAAAGIWAMYDHLIYPDRIVHGYGHYHETYRLEADGEWRIATLRLTRLLYESTSIS